MVYCSLLKKVEKSYSFTWVYSQIKKHLNPLDILFQIIIHYSISVAKANQNKMLKEHLICDAPWASLIAQLVKNPPAMQETLVWFLSWEYPKKERLPTPVFWPGEFHGLSKESDTTEWLSLHYGWWKKDSHKLSDDSPVKGFSVIPLTLTVV